MFPAGYNNGFAPERTNHQLNYDAQYPAGDDRRFAANSHLLELYNGGRYNRAALGTDLGKLLPNTIGPQNPVNNVDPGFRRRLMELTGGWTVPHIVIDDRPIGGYTELWQLDRSGELARLAA